MSLPLRKTDIASATIHSIGSAPDKLKEYKMAVANIGPAQSVSVIQHGSDRGFVLTASPLTERSVKIRKYLLIGASANEMEMINKLIDGSEEFRGYTKTHNFATIDENFVIYAPEGTCHEQVWGPFLRWQRWKKESKAFDAVNLGGFGFSLDDADDIGYVFARAWDYKRPDTWRDTRMNYNYAHDHSADPALNTELGKLNRNMSVLKLSTFSAMSQVNLDKMRDEGDADTALLIQMTLDNIGAITKRANVHHLNVT